MLSVIYNYASKTVYERASNIPVKKFIKSKK